jgi:predicted kinase
MHERGQRVVLPGTMALTQGGWIVKGADSILGAADAMNRLRRQRLEECHKRQGVIIELLCGMIGSGKSIYARSHADRGSLVVSHDDLTSMLHADYRYESGRRGMYRQMEQELVRVAIDHHCFHVIIDRTHLTTESRVCWIDFGLEINVPVIATCFPISEPEVHAIRRFKADPRGRSLDEWMGVARHHANQARREPIRLDEGFKEVSEHELSPEQKAEDEAENQRIIRLKDDAEQCWMNGINPYKSSKCDVVDMVTRVDERRKAERVKARKRRPRYGPLQALLDQLAADKEPAP